MAIQPKGYYTDPETNITYPDLTMNEEEILEREELNIANTSASLRARVLQQLATANGHGTISS